MNKPTTLEEAKKEKYGINAKSAYVEGRCVQDVWEGWRNYQCTRKNGHGPDNLYCKQHAKKFAPAEPKQPPIARLTATEKSFCSGIRKALNLLDLHGMDTIYDELVNMCNVTELVKAAIDDGELEFSGLAKHGYAKDKNKKTTITRQDGTMNQPTPRITWKKGNVTPDKTGEYLAAWQIGPDEYTYTVEMYYVDTGWEAKGFLAFSPDFWQEIRPPKVKQQ